MPVLKPKKSLGQNFLTDKNISLKIVNSIGITENDFVIEIGPGEGALTQSLLQSKAGILAIEIDSRACLELEKKFSRPVYPNFNLVQADFMDFDLGKYMNENNILKRIKIIGNLPYYISSRIIYKVIENAGLVEKSVFMLQKEVAGRLSSGPGNKSYGILSVAVDYAGTIKRLFDVPPQCFFPRPKVTSTVFELNFREGFNIEVFSGMMEIVKAAFNQRRKKLRNALSSFYSNKYGSDISGLEIKYGKNVTDYLNKRAEELSCNDYISIWEMMNDRK